MVSISHPNVIAVFGFVEDMQKGDAWIILPWEANGNVREFLQSGEWEIPERISLVCVLTKTYNTILTELIFLSIASRYSKRARVLAHSRPPYLSRRSQVGEIKSSYLFSKIFA